METPRLIDLATMTDAEVAEVYDLPFRAGRLAAPDVPFLTVAESVAEVRNLPPSQTLQEWVVEGGLVGLLSEANGAECYLKLFVAPESRRRGIGTLLVEFAAEQARAVGRKRLIGGFYDQTGAAFAAGLGARFGNTLLNSVLKLPKQIDPRPVPGYTVRSWQGSAPEELMDSWIAALAAINDAPRTEGRSPTRFTAETVRDHERTSEAAGFHTRVTVALAPDGEVVATTEMLVGHDSGACARIEETSVAAAHRRKGLSRWIKQESLVSLMNDRPDVRLAQTFNDAGNVGMLAVNQAVGFETVGRYTQVVIDL